MVDQIWVEPPAKKESGCGSTTLPCLTTVCTVEVRTNERRLFPVEVHHPPQVVQTVVIVPAVHVVRGNLQAGHRV